MAGVFFALMTALAWAGSSTILKFLSTKVDTLSLGTLRLWSGSAFILIILCLSGRSHNLLNTPPETFILVALTGLLGIALGDSLFIWSLRYIDLSRAFTIVMCTFPLLTMVVSIVFFSEPFSWFNIMGALLVLGGVYLVAVVGRRSSLPLDSDKTNLQGLALALTAAATWTMATVALKVVVITMDSIVAAAIRIPISAAAITILVLAGEKGQKFKIKEYGLRNILMAISSGILTYGLGAVFYVLALQQTGAGKTVLITSASPIFVLPFSVLILKERPAPPTIFGAIACVAGVILVSLG